MITDPDIFAAEISRRGLTVRQVIEKAQINQSTWSRWKSGETDPMKTVRALNEALESLSSQEAA